MLAPIGLRQKTNSRPMGDAALDVFSITYRAADDTEDPKSGFSQVDGVADLVG